MWERDSDMVWCQYHSDTSDHGYHPRSQSWSYQDECNPKVWYPVAVGDEPYG